MRITAQNVEYAYNKGAKFAVAALDGASLEIAEGEFFGIIGRTGSGKSTFIQHLNALIPLQKGELLVGEYDLSVQKGKNKPNLKELRKCVGMVFQYPEYQLFAETVYADVAFGIRNFTQERDEKKIAELVFSALEKVGLNYYEIKDKSPFSLSGGQKRRVAIAGVIAINPEVLVLDEPCAGLDPKGKAELWSLLHYIHATTAKTVIVVSHDMNDVAEQCTKAAAFAGGKIVACGTPEELFSDEKLIETVALDAPLTAYLKKELSPYAEIETNYRIEDFARAVAGILQKR